MCQIIVFTKAPYADKPKKQRLLFNKLLTELGTTQRDGLGIAWIGADGGLHRRRWAQSEDFKGLTVDDMRGPLFEVTSEPVDNTPATGFVIMHGRTATSEKGLTNNHPHCGTNASGAKFALVHNGVVNASFEAKKALGDLLTGCDSELILAAFMAGGVEKVSEIITGYYAFAVIVLNSDGTQYLHVVRDDRAMLYGSEDANGRFIFATTPLLLNLAGGGEYCKFCALTRATFMGDGTLMDIGDIPKPKFDTYSGSYGSGWNRPAYVPTTPAYSPPPVVPASTTPIILPGPRTPKEQEEQNANYYERWCKNHGLDANGDPLPGHQPRQSEMPLDDPKNNAELAELDRRLAKVDLKIHSLTELDHPDLDDHAQIQQDIAKACQRRERLVENRRMLLAGADGGMPGEEEEESVDATTGVSTIHSQPISTEEAEALRTAEREASGVIPAGEGDPPSNHLVEDARNCGGI